MLKDIENAKIKWLSKVGKFNFLYNIAKENDLIIYLSPNLEDTKDYKRSNCYIIETEPSLNSEEVSYIKKRFPTKQGVPEIAFLKSDFHISIIYSEGKKPKPNLYFIDTGGIFFSDNKILKTLKNLGFKHIVLNSVPEKSNNITFEKTNLNFLKLVFKSIKKMFYAKHYCVPTTLAIMFEFIEKGELDLEKIAKNFDTEKALLNAYENGKIGNNEMFEFVLQNISKLNSNVVDLENNNKQKNLYCKVNIPKQETEEQETEEQNIFSSLQSNYFSKENEIKYTLDGIER